MRFQAEIWKLNRKISTTDLKINKLIEHKEALVIMRNALVLKTNQSKF
jgi:hypothetical protein